MPEKWVEKVGNYSQGIRGESMVIEKLESILSDEYTIIPSVVISDYGDTDIVVVGPKGVIAIEVKNWSDPITIKDGKIWRQMKSDTQRNLVTSDPFAQVKGQAGSIQRLLNNEGIDCSRVTPVVVFAGGDIHWEGKNPTLLFHVDSLHKMPEHTNDKDIYSSEDLVKICSILNDRSFS